MRKRIDRKEKKIVHERKVLTEQEWIALILAVFKPFGLSADVDRIEFDYEGQEVRLGRWASITQAEDTETLASIVGDVTWKGYALTTFCQTYSYSDGPDVVETEHGFFKTPYAAVEALAMICIRDRMSNIIEGFLAADQMKEEEEYEKAMDKAEAEMRQKGADAYSEMGGDYRERLEAHNRDVLKGL